MTKRKKDEIDELIAKTTRSIAKSLEQIRTVEERFENEDGEELHAEPLDTTIDVPDEFKEAQVNWHPRPKFNTMHLHRLSAGQISIEVFLQMYPGETVESITEALDQFRKVKG
jgi:hypothetical protein